jgi:hypothetical protein
MSVSDQSESEPSEDNEAFSKVKLASRQAAFIFEDKNDKHWICYSTQNIRAA